MVSGGSFQHLELCFSLDSTLPLSSPLPFSQNPRAAADKFGKEKGDMLGNEGRE